MIVQICSYIYKYTLTVQVNAHWYDYAGTCLEDENSSANISQLDEKMQGIVCSENFYLEERGGQRVCLPECGKWGDLPRSAEVATDVVVILHSVVYIISATAVLVLSCIQYERM